MNLREALEYTLSGQQRGGGRFVHLCKDIALAYLKSKIASGDHYLSELQEELEDLAWDCIADLFERDEGGRFIQLEKYYDELLANETSEGELKIKTRRLVFSKVNDSLFRIFGNRDASLSKIIRNVKNACDELNLEVTRISKSNAVIFGKRSIQNKPSMPPEFLEIKLSHRVTGSMNMIEIMEEVKRIFLRQKLYAKQASLVTVARVIRRSYVNNNDRYKSYKLPANPLFLQAELRNFVSNAVDRHREQFYETYVSKGKVDEDIFDAYMDALEHILKHNYVEESTQGDSYYDHLKQRLPNLKKKEYRSNHRQYVEYMVKLVRKDLMLRLKKVV